jgi:hypothetical protein
VLLYKLCYFTMPFSSKLAALSGKLSIPESPPFYSQNMTKLIGLCLKDDPDLRPTAVQLLSIAAALKEVRL